jgi:gliding motility-associated-like protein
MKLVVPIFILTVLATLSANEAAGQEFTGNWQGTNYSPGSATTEYWPVSLTLSQNNTSLEGTMHFSARDMPQYYVTFAVKGHTTGPDSFWLDLNTIVDENKETDENVWCVGSGNFTLDRSSGKFNGVIDFTNCPFKGQTELFRLELTSDKSYCSMETADLHVTGSNVKWYADQRKSNLLAEGNSYRTTLTESTVFYVTQTHYDTESPVLPIEIAIKTVTFETNVVSECDRVTGALELSSDDPDIEFRLDQGPFTRTQNFRDIPAGHYTVTGRSGECLHSEDVHLALHSSPVIDDIDVAHVTCREQDGVITILASAGTLPFVYKITGTQEQSGNVFRTLAAGTYEIEVMDAEGCTARGNAEIQIPENVVTIHHVETTDPRCDASDGRIEVEITGGTGPFSYSLDNISYQPEPVFASLIGGDYTVYVRDNNRCEDQSKTALSTPQPLPELVIRKTNAECEKDNGTIQIDIPVANDIIYTLNDSVTISTTGFSRLPPGSYHLKASSSSDCHTETFVQIESNCLVPVRFPNAISPNGDALNETFSAFFNKDFLKVSSFFIYNRWGNVIHHKQNFELKSGEPLWDGTTSGYSSEPGVYAYRMEVNLNEELKYTYNGIVEIIR